MHMHDADARFNRALALFRGNRPQESLEQVEDFRRHWGTLAPAELGIRAENREANDKKANQLLQALGVNPVSSGEAVGVAREGWRGPSQ